MKLLMLCDYPLSASEINGGVASASHNLVKSLLEHTTSQIVVFGFHSAHRSRTPQLIDNGRLKVIRCKMPRLGHARNFRWERKLIGRIIRDECIDIVHAQSEGPYASLAVGSGKPNVYTIHGIRLKELDMARSELGIFRHYLQSRLIRKHHSRARHIVAINRYTEAAISGLHSAKVWTIPNAVDDRFFSLAMADKIECGSLLLVGGVRPRKDVVMCLEAVSQLARRGINVTLDIVGPNDAVYLERVQEFIRENRLKNVVRIHGLVSSSVIDALYRKADIAVLSSVEESSPICLVEAMAARKPIISTDVGGISEMVKVGENAQLVPAGDAGSFQKAIENLVLDRELRERFARRSQEIAVSDWSARSVALRTFEMYEEIAHGG